MGNVLARIMPCMTSVATEGDPTGLGPGTVTLSITSTSSCCKGKTVQLKLNNEHVAEISKLMAELIAKNEEKVK